MLDRLCHRALPVIVFGCFAFMSCQRAERADQRIIIGETVIVPSKSLTKDLIVAVYLPDGYAEKSRRYPLLVTCQIHSLHVSGIAADLALKNGAPEPIVASPRNSSSDDFIPEKIEGHPGSGGADRFIAFFRDELIPYLDAHYRTRPSLGVEWPACAGERSPGNRV